MLKFDVVVNFFFACAVGVAWRLCAIRASPNFIDNIGVVLFLALTVPCALEKQFILWVVDTVLVLPAPRGPFKVVNFELRSLKVFLDTPSDGEVLIIDFKLTIWKCLDHVINLDVNVLFGVGSFEVHRMFRELKNLKDWLSQLI